MGNEYTKSEVSRQIIDTHSKVRKGLNFVDNRPCSILQTKLIRVVQRAADLKNGQSIPQAIKDFRKSCMYLTYDTKLGDSTIYVGGRMGQGFGMNAGIINGEVAIFNDYKSTHTEPMLISKKYKGAYGDWTTANEAVDERPVNSDGKVLEPFELFTERVPCPTCQSSDNLKHQRYQQTDIVKSHFAAHVEPKTVAATYIEQAKDKFPGYEFTPENYGLTGTKKQEEGASAPPPAKKIPPLPKDQPSILNFFPKKTK